MIKIIRGLGLIVILSGLVSCKPPDPPKTIPTAKTKIEDNSRLTLNNATLEQADPKGQTLWKIQVNQANYSQDQKIAYLEKIKGNIYQDGKIVLQVTADNGEVYKDGQEILLKNNIRAIDPRNQAIIRAKEVRWQPKEGILIVRDDLKGSHLKLDATAKEGKYDTRKQRLELTGNVVANAKADGVRLTTERLIWEIPRRVMETDRPVAFDRYDNEGVKERLTAKGGRWEIANRSVFLQGELIYRSLESPLQVVGNAATWKYGERLLISDSPLEIRQTKDEVTITANRGRMDLKANIAYLLDGVKGLNNKTGAKLYSNNLTWNLNDRVVTAEGRVIYEQVEPRFNVTGDRAVGTLEDNNIVVSSNSPDRVVTEIQPK